MRTIQQKKLLLVVLFIMAAGLLPVKLSAQLVTSGVTTNAFIKNQFIQAGFSNYGCYASTLYAPAGYIGGPTSASFGGTHGGQAGKVGFVSCPSGNWSDLSGIYGDFILPGVIYDGFSVVLTPEGGSREIYMNNGGNGYYYIQPKLVSFTFNSPAGTYTDVTWHGEVPGVFDIDCRFEIVGLRILHYTTITNTSGIALNEVYFTRGMDPDQENGAAGICSSAETYNYIESQADGTPGKPSWLVAYGFCTPAMIAYYCEDPRSRAAISGLNSSSWYYLLNNPEYAYGLNPLTNLFVNEGEYSRIEAHDASIELAIAAGNIPAGGSITLEHEIRLDQPAIVHFEEPVTQTKNECQTFTYTLTREHQMEETVAVTVQLSAQSGTTTLTTSDFDGISSLPHEYTVTFLPGETTKTLSVIAACDAGTEVNETFRLQITAVSTLIGGQAGVPNIVTGTIIDVPIPILNNIADNSLCAGSMQPAITFSGSNVDAASCTWTNSNPGIGLAASGTGNIPAFTVSNSTGLPMTATITVTPVSAGGAIGVPKSFTIEVTPAVVPTITIQAAPN